MAEQNPGTEYTLQGELSTPRPGSRSWLLSYYVFTGSNKTQTFSLAGVMRFLQIEWHNHERARNAWDIERAEMKAKIAKQEGDCRSSRKLTETLDRQVRMLEKALKQERGKNKAATTTESPPPPPPPPVEEEVKKEWSENMGIKPKTQTGTPRRYFRGLLRDSRL